LDYLQHLQPLQALLAQMHRCSDPVTQQEWQSPAPSKNTAAAAADPMVSHNTPRKQPPEVESNREPQSPAPSKDLLLLLLLLILYVPQQTNKQPVKPRTIGRVEH
jgi:hypothetical protein